MPPSDGVVVVGAGVAGLTTAYRLLRTDPDLDITVVEAGARLGGKLATAQVGDLEVEAGPDSFVARKPSAVELCRELGLELIEPGASGAFVWTPHGLEPFPPTALGVPADVDALLRWRGLSRPGRVRAARDLVRKASPPAGDEPLGALVRRRLGDEAANVLVQPLLGGLYAGDIDRLGVLATFPELGRWERELGSLIRGAKAALTAGGNAGPMFLKPASGVSALPGALVAAIGPARIRPDAPVRAIGREGLGFVVRGDAWELPARAVVLATPAFVAGELLEDLAPPLAAALTGIAYASTGVVLLAYPAGSADALPDATGFVVPSGRAPMTAATFLSRKWPSPAFGDRAVIRCFVGGVGIEDVLDAPDAEIVEAVARHLAAVLPLPADPGSSSVVRWPRAMPQLGVGHLDRVTEIERSLPPGIFVTGNAYGGIGVADTIRHASEVAERVREHLTGDPAKSEREHVR